MPVSSAALIFDDHGRLLIVRPTYKSGWLLPGGQMESNGESPWDACRREVFEETRLSVAAGQLVCVDFIPPHRSDPGGVRFLFDCGRISAAQIASIIPAAGELDEHRFAPVPEALSLLRPAVSRRVRHALGAAGPSYLERGRPVAAVSCGPVTGGGV